VILLLLRFIGRTDKAPQFEGLDVRTLHHSCGDYQLT
jgi:hypothetical protein